MKFDCAKRNLHEGVLHSTELLSIGEAGAQMT